MWHFGRVVAFGSVLAVLAALCAPSEVVAQKKKAAAVVDNGYGATPEDYKQIQNKKELTGTIVSASGTVVTLRVDTPRMEPNPKYKPNANNPSSTQQNRLYQDSQRLQRDLAQAQNTTNPQTRARAMQKYYQDMARFQQQSQQIYNQLATKAAAKNPGGTTGNTNTNNTNNTTDPFLLVHSYKEYDLETTDKLVVKKNFLPLEYDDMGNLKKYTDKEKAELRGDDKNTPPRYKSKFEEIAAGMEARISLIPPKTKKKDAKDTKDTKADDDDTGVGNVERPTVSGILLTKDAPMTTTTGADPKKKKKNN